MAKKNDTKNIKNTKPIAKEVEKVVVETPEIVEDEIIEDIVEIKEEESVEEIVAEAITIIEPEVEEVIAIKEEEIITEYKIEENKPSQTSFTRMFGYVWNGQICDE